MSRPASLQPPKLPCGIVDLLQPGAVRRHFRDHEKPVDAVPTPLPTWNRNCRDDDGGVGLAHGWHVTIASNTGTGKSLLALNLAAKALEGGESVGLISLEMSRAQTATRLYAIITGSDVRELERGQSFSPGAVEKVSARIAEIHERTGVVFYMNDQPIFDIDSIQGLMRYFAESKGCRWFAVDYLQLACARDAESLFQQVSNVSARIREFAKRLNIVTVGLSQFNRQTSANWHESPTIQGLMGGSSVENDSDQVLLLDHSRYRPLKPERRALTWALLSKNRHGDQGVIPIEWDYRTLRVREALPHEESEWP